MHTNLLRIRLVLVAFRRRKRRMSPLGRPCNEWIILPPPFIAHFVIPADRRGKRLGCTIAACQIDQYRIVTGKLPLRTIWISAATAVAAAKQAERPSNASRIRRASRIREASVWIRRSRQLGPPQIVGHFKYPFTTIAKCLITGSESFPTTNAVIFHGYLPAE